LFFIYNWKNIDIYKYNAFLVDSVMLKDNLFTINYNKDFSYYYNK
jgi:hypothetical protein